jgi:hypothetical protein
MLGAAAASVQFSRSIGAAFGTAAVASVLFAMLSATDRETAALFGTMMEQGANVLSSLPLARQAIVQSEIAEAFRAAFLVIAGFAGAGALLAMSIPLRRIYCNSEEGSAWGIPAETQTSTVKTQLQPKKLSPKCEGCFTGRFAAV